MDVLLLSAIIIAVAIISKLAGCGLPATIFLRDKSRAMRVGIGMISRGEVGLIVAGIGVTSGVLSSNIYTTGHHYGCCNYTNYSNVVKESIC